MHRRQFNSNASAMLALALAGMPVWAQAINLSGLSNADATAGLKATLEKGASAAISLLGQEDGFMNNPKVRIGLPKPLDEVAGMLRRFGQGHQLDELVTAMNRAAEQAIPLAKGLLHDTIQSLTITDAKSILGGGDNSVTQFFEGKTREPLSQRFLPDVSKATARVGVAEKYKQVASKAASVGLLKQEDAQLDTYVTARALDGLYLVIGEKEREFRSNPLAAGSAVIEKALGALRP
ncbi:DUF4197 domain-containing protein [Curvibacter gracilis]|uniref:DUF4197 domain-containing protein n=1 Tax=Curvibacter gracilis TaxID=230310 RepID=UPI00047F9BB7|nr:DUF4197 domain-containing protein [Curvibacter gracilis]